MRTGKRTMTRYEREVLMRCILYMVGAIFFFMLAAASAYSVEYSAYPPDSDPWYFPEEEEENSVRSAGDHMLASRLQRRFAGNRLSYNRNKASKPQDSVTIIVKESTSSEITSSNDLKRDSSNNMALTNWITPSFSGGLGTRQHGELAGGNTPTISWNSNRAHKSDSTIERTQYLTSTLTGQVIEVKPNGYLVIEAKKQVNINGEVQTMTLTGMVNPMHLDSTSTVQAEHIMDMRVEYTGKGPMTRMDKRGWGAKAIDFLNPF